MADKQQILAGISELSSQGLLTEQEILQSFQSGQGALSGGAGADHSLSRHLSISELMYYIGGFIVFLGIVILLAQNWDSLGTPVKILVTFGASVVAILVGVLFARDERTSALAQPFYLISCLTFPVGIYQILGAFGFEVNGAWDFSLIFLIVSAWMFVWYFVMKRLIFLLFGILSITILFFAFTDALIVKDVYFSGLEKFYEYRILIAGMSYLLLGYYFTDRKPLSHLTGMLYGFGTIAFLGAAFALQGFRPNQNVIWELVYPLLSIVFMLLSIYLSRKVFLIFGALSLMAYVVKITGEYFSEGLGWPLALVLCGLAFIGIGYLAFYLNKKYFNRSMIASVQPPRTQNPS